MTAKRRPKVRYVDKRGSHGWFVCHVDGIFGVLCEASRRADAKRIAAALNWHEARKRGEL